MPAGEPTVPGILASDAERDATIELLRRAGGEGRLTYEELADRLDVAGRARTREELAQVSADLPVSVGHSIGQGDLAASVRNSKVFGNLVREGRWHVPERSRWSSLFGDVRLDLREAVVTQPLIHVHAELVFGDLELLVPEGVVVDLRVRTLVGDVIQEAGEIGLPNSPRILVEGWTLLGDVKVRSRRLRGRFGERRTPSRGA